MTMILYPLIFVIWLVVLFIVLPKPAVSRRYAKATGIELASFLGYDKVKADAENAGISLNAKEFIQIAGISAVVGILIAVLIHNMFFIAAGIYLSFMVPRFIFMKLKRRKRTNILFELPSKMKLYVSKLSDFPSLELALENALPDIHGETRASFEKAYNGLTLKLPPAVVIAEWRKEIRIKKFTDFTDKLLMAHEEGFTERSIKSLNETAAGMGSDVKLLKTIQLKNKRKYRSLYMTIAVAWLIPIMLSTMNSQNGNVFLNTIHGQIFIALLFMVSIYSIVKGDDYLSLNLEEL